ncbi:MAG: hypothetical protein IKY17_03610 [Oscillospiraceae bacterium]|nr:hypothetical protein [Oscillospiraceae bacterium]
MERISRVRALLLLAAFGLILLFYSGKLFSEQLIKHNGSTSNAKTYTTYTTVKGTRGDLLDRNGNVLVGNRASYNLVFNHYVIKGVEGRNEYLRTLVNRVEELDLTYAEHFPISRTRPFEYTLEEYSRAWQGYFQKYMMDRDLDSDMTAPMLIEVLREHYEIPAEWSPEDARAVIGLLYEFDLRGIVGVGVANYVFIEDASDTALAEIVELGIPGLRVEPSTVREYHTTYAAHILGYVGAMDAEQWETYKKIVDKNGNKLYNMDASIGQSGLEKAFEEYLHGIDGTRVDVTAAEDGTIISQTYLEGKEPQGGNHVELTIDLPTQIATEDALAELADWLRDPILNPSGDGDDVEGLAAVVMEVKTGDILAMASYPTYDLSTFREVYAELLEAEGAPLMNRAIQGIYPPGSTYKMSTLISAMENGKLAPGETIYTKGKFTKYESSGFAPTCLAWTSSLRQHGVIDATVAIQKSCNYFFYELADRMDIDMMDKTAKALGLGEKTGVELDEKTGYRANRETKKELFKGSDAHFTVGDRVNAGIGQSENRFTPLQLCVYTCTLANKGVRYKATFLNRVVSDDYSELMVENTPEIVSTLDISDVTYETYMTGMKMVANVSGGTGYSKLKDCVVEVAAKTGTAEHGLGSKYSSHGAIICFAPADDPQIAVAIYGEKAAHGSTLGMAAASIINSYFSGDESTVTSAENQLS